jgi:Tol biopolymer transport system component
MRGPPTAVLLLAVLLLPPTACDWGYEKDDEIIRVSLSSTGEEADRYSFSPVISADGRVVAFVSAAANLVPDDTNECHDVFVHDCETGLTERVSVSSTGEQGDDSSCAYQSSGHVAISADGRLVAFTSAATNLVPCDTNGAVDVFVHDRETGETERVSVDSSGEEADARVYDISISADGRYVAFISWATNLVPGDTNGMSDVFVHDRHTGETERANIGPSGEQADGMSYAVAISGDGRFVAFESPASNLVPGDTGGLWCDVFVHDRETGETERASVTSFGEEADGECSRPSISADGRIVAFHSSTRNMSPCYPNTSSNWRDDVVVRDLDSRETVAPVCREDSVLRGNTNAHTSLSADGRFAAFLSSGRVYVHDRRTGRDAPAGVDLDGDAVGGGAPRISADGRWIAFASAEPGLVPGDANDTLDVFVAPNPLAP